MKDKSKLFTCALLCMLLAGCKAEKEKPLVDYVYQYIGTVNPKNSGTSPVTKVPNGNLSVFPQFNPRFIDKYFSDKIFGFPLGVADLMVNTGSVKIGAEENASAFDHDLETATPYYYQVLLEDPDINTEFTLTKNTVLFRFTLPQNETSNILLTLKNKASVSVKENNVIEGEALLRDRNSNSTKRYFYAKLNKPLASCGTWEGQTISPETKTKAGEDIGLYLSYATKAQKETVEMNIGISSNSVEEARSFVENEIGNLSFDQVKDKGRDLWNEELSLIKVKGGTEKQRSLFYTTLHRARALRMGNVWDTYRCAYPLQVLISPELTDAVINGWLEAYDKTGWLPSSGAMIGHHSTPVIVDAYMKGVRGYDVEKAYQAMRKNAMEATMIPWKDGALPGKANGITKLEQHYFDKGYYPALNVRKDINPATYMQDKFYNRGGNNGKINYNKMPYQRPWLDEVGVEEDVPEVDKWHRRQSVAVTLEHCYDDWCLAQMAKALGKTDDYELFMKRAHNYQNVYNPKFGLMAPKSEDGTWVEPYDPMFSGGFAGEAYFAEGNSWMYTWHVQHDVQGLINLMGGRDIFNRRLDSLFTIDYSRIVDKLQFQAQYPDMSGLVGMYSHGNEPDFHITYLYNYSGQPWKTQYRVRQQMEMWYDTTPFGLSGDEDGGAMSSWYVWSAMGLYPQCPGQPTINIGSPIFEESVINVGNGKTFTVEAKNVSAQNKYIQSATLNGQPWNKPWIHHDDMKKGGKLVLQMGPRPNKSWGSAPQDAPPSMSGAL